MPFCGPKLSLCCLLLSVWGVVQLTLMGIFFFNNSVALIEDLPMAEAEDIKDLNSFYAEADAAYTQNAYNCWVAACLYLLTFLISAQQFYANNNASPTTAF